MPRSATVHFMGRRMLLALVLVVSVGVVLLHLPTDYRRLSSNTPVPKRIYKSNKRYFVIHAGAHKTGTTAVQATLGQWTAGLLQDNYVYLGKFLNHNGNHQTGHRSAAYEALFRDRDCLTTVQNYYKAQDNTDATETEGGYSPPTCWSEFLKELEQHADRNLIISEEGFGTRWLEPELWNSSTTNNEYSAMSNLIRALDDRWEIVVIVAYRRLYEWIPSAKQQQERWHRTKTVLDKWPGEGGRSLVPLFPNYVLKHPYVVSKSKGYIGYRYTNDILRYFRQHNTSISLLNYHSSFGVKTEFFCNMIPGTPTTCAWAKNLSASDDAIVNGRQSDQIFDRLVTMAAERGWIDTKTHSRHDMVVAAQKHLEQQGQTIAEMEQSCPTKDQLRILLKASLRMEDAILPNFSKEQEHIDGFWRASERNKFCSINPGAELEKQHWKQFFGSYSLDETVVK